MSTETRGTVFLKTHRVPFSVHLYDYEEKGGTRVSSAKLGADEHSVIKTLVFEDEQSKPFVVLMHGDCRVSSKQLARELKVKRVAACAVETAERHTGYQVGGTSPFGLKKPLAIYCEQTVTTLPSIFINGGGRGFLVQINPADLVRALQPTLVNCAEPR